MIAPVEHRVSSTGIENSFAVEQNGEVLIHLADIAMSINIDTGMDFPHDNLEQADKSTLIQIIQTLAGEVSSVKSELSSVKSEVSSLREDSDRNSREIADTNGRVSEVEDEVDDIHENVDRASKKIADSNSRISDIEDDIDSDESSGDHSSPSDPKGESGQTSPSALEQICSLPEHVADDNLTKNQQRARSVAMNIETYGRSVPAGVALSFSRLRSVLTAQEDSRAHYQTVRRVAEFLSEFGDDEVEVTETRGGDTVVVFRERLVDMLTDVVTSADTPAASPVLI